jgi:hypothetical protein
MWLEVHVHRDDYHARLGSRVASSHDAQSRILEYLADDYDITGVKVDGVAWVRDSSKSGWGPKSEAGWRHCPYCQHSHPVRSEC